MNKDKIVLKDGTEITLESSQGIGVLNVQAESVDDVCDLWKKFTKENLKQITIKNSDGLTVGRYSEMVLDHIEGREDNDSGVLATFSLREKSAFEVLEERVSDVEAGQSVQDEGIDDLARVVSDIAEGGKV